MNACLAKPIPSELVYYEMALDCDHDIAALQSCCNAISSRI